MERELERREKAARREAEYTGPTPQTRTQQQQRDWTRHGSAATPAAGTEFGETPGHTPLRSSTAQHSEEPSPTASYDHLSLTEFLNTYTSEDNASFAEILQRNNETRRQKNAWAFVGEAAANASAQASRDKRHRLIEAVKLAVESSEDGSVKMIEGAEPGRPGERLLLEPGRDSIVADKSSVQNAKNRITAPETSSASAQLLIEGSPSTKTENQEGQLIKPQEESKLSSEAPVARTSQQSKLEGKDAGMVESWPYTVSLPPNSVSFRH